MMHPPGQHRMINMIGFSTFQVVGAWANTGMSLVDQNMAPYSTAYPMITVLILCVLAGNAAYPIFLRFFIWLLTKILPAQSRTTEALHFLLDHPRRCLFLLFPAYQTWLLLAIQLATGLIALSFDLLLNPAMDHIPIDVRLINAALQSAAVRSAGFQSVPVSSFVPAVQVLYVILMYIAVYPIAISVRSTNVYEARSLGIYKADNDTEDADSPNDAASGFRVAIWGPYLCHHVRKQLSFDMWWLALSLFVLCIIEQAPLMAAEDATRFTIFALIFELVSAYGTVGLSLGAPYANYSLSGALRPLSRIVVCAAMLRGRHRGLPLALDRAVLLPHEFQTAKSAEMKCEEMRTPSVEAKRNASEIPLDAGKRSKAFNIPI